MDCLFVPQWPLFATLEVTTKNSHSLSLAPHIWPLCSPSITLTIAFILDLRVRSLKGEYCYVP